MNGGGENGRVENRHGRGLLRESLLKTNCMKKWM